MTTPDAHPLIEATAVPGQQSWLTPRRYWLICSAIILAYLAVWLVNFRYVYGWIMDDLLVFTKARLTLEDFWAPFRADNRNALQSYFYLISYLPLALGIELTSHPLPVLGEKTGQFRFLLLYVVLLHTLLLFVWAWFMTRITKDRVTALVALILLVVSPTFVLWTPLPESRVLGMLFVLPGTWLLLRIETRHRTTASSIASLAGAGVLFSIGINVHYTSLYFVFPLCVCYWLPRLIGGFASRIFWGDLCTFVLELLSIPIATELLSRFAAGLPWEAGPMMYMIHSRGEHSSVFDLAGDLRVWWSCYWEQMGPAMLMAIGLGWAVFLSLRKRVEGRAIMALSFAIPLGIALLLVSRQKPFFRYTSVLQPFLFLFAAFAVTAIARRLSRKGAVQCVAGVALAVIVVGWQARGAWAVYQGHLGLGRALEAAAATDSSKKPNWLGIAWYGHTDDVVPLDHLSQAEPGTLLVTYYPCLYMWDHPEQVPYFHDVEPVATFPTLWKTDAIQAELMSYWLNIDWRRYPVMSDARVYRIDDLRAAMSGPTLAVKEVRADSVSAPAWEPVNIFDRGAAPDTCSLWRSDETPMPHHVDIHFEVPTTAHDIRIVMPNVDDSSFRIRELTILGLDGDTPGAVLWHGDDLDQNSVISATWPATELSGVRLRVDKGSIHPWLASRSAVIDEVVFPGYTLKSPPPTREMPPIQIDEIVCNGEGVHVIGSGLTQYCVFRSDGRDIRMKRLNPHNYRVMLPAERSRSESETLKGVVCDENRASRPLEIELPGPPVLRKVTPSEAIVGRPFVEQPDGTCAISIDCENILPGTVAVFDDTPLRSYFGTEIWMTANVPPALLQEAGTYSVRLRNAFGESDPVEFVILPNGKSSRTEQVSAAAP